VTSAASESTAGRAPGKVILLGEHFVVHGAPALAVPVERHVKVTVLRQPGAWDVAEVAIPHLRAMLEHLGEDPEAVTLRVEATLPFGSGLGGSAALGVALVRALGHRDEERVRALAHELEKLAHGNPSGIDDTVSAYARPVWYVRGETPQPVEAPAGLPLWIGLTPSGASTREAVAGVGRLSREQPAFFANRLAEAKATVQAGLEALKVADWPELGRLMRHNHQLLVDVGVSTPLLDRLVDAAMQAGAFGAKLTGGGLGGAMIVLAPADAPIEATLMQHGAVDVIAPQDTNGTGQHG